MYNVYHLLQSNTAHYPDKPALIYKGQRISYRELGERINSLAHSLSQLGAKLGSRVGLLMPNCAEFVEAFYGAQKLGAVAVPFNYRLKASEIKELVEATQCEYFIYDQKYADIIAELKSQVFCIKEFIYTGDIEVDHEHSYEELLKRGDPLWDFVQPVCDQDDALFIFTGGTTGVSKAARHTQEALLLKVSLTLMGEWRFNPQDVFLNYAPMFHVGGLSFVLFVLSSGACMIIADRFDVDELLRTIDREKVTQMFIIPPSIFKAMKDSPLINDIDTSSMRYLMFSGGDTSDEIVKSAFELFPKASILNGYGHSENAAIINNILTREQYGKKPGLICSIGKPMAFSQIKLVNDQGYEVKKGECGEAWARGPAQMRGYLNRPNPFVDCWFPTGDILRQDEEGYFYFMERKKDMIKCGGENIFANEVESVVSSHPAVSSCAVVGLADPLYSEIVAAAVVLKNDKRVTEEQLIEYCKSKLASYKKPKKVFFLKELPLSSVGKVKKYTLREQLDRMQGC
ncbi:class I adenylate-forming enzyme family protein [Desulfitobacterium sp. THU1]|uniref:class I adenylate-forming enzyme family protein n=1 Tax=Desulfitobacterium sp. THU1 TaxID=3138072 RepID=UPI00311EF081